MKRFSEKGRRIAIETGIEFMPVSKTYRVSLYRDGKDIASQTVADLASARRVRAALEAEHPRQRPGGVKPRKKLAV